MEIKQEWYTLADYFFEQVIQRILSTNQRQSTAEYIGQLVAEGWTKEEIRSEMDTFAKEYPEMVRNVYTLQQIMSNKKPPHNLLEEDIFYYHNKLRVTSGPAKIIKSPETGKFVRTEPPYYLEMVKVFTIEELLEYWYLSSETIPNESILRKDKGRFDYLLGFYDVDEVLFMIDIAQQIRKDMNQRLLKNIFDLEKYVDAAKEAIKEKRSIARLQNVNKIIERVDAE